MKRDRTDYDFLFNLVKILGALLLLYVIIQAITSMS